MQAIENLKPEGVADKNSGNFAPMAALLRMARNKNLRVDTVAIDIVLDTSGHINKSVGFGAWEFYEPSTRPV